MILVGVDEAGRGSLVSSVVAAAVILNTRSPVRNLYDSKKISAKKRSFLYEEIQLKALSFCIAEASVKEIDELNILQATMLAMRRAVDGLRTPFDKVLVDGNQLPCWSYRSEAIVRGDNTVEEISAASILAKVHRDRQMQMLDEQYPQYGFKQHKGYPTHLHISMIEKLGIIPEHRKSYAPIQKILFKKD